VNALAHGAKGVGDPGHAAQQILKVEYGGVGSNPTMQRSPATVQSASDVQPTGPPQFVGSTQTGSEYAGGTISRLVNAAITTASSLARMASTGS
jgi:hypothetical protein